MYASSTPEPAADWHFLASRLGARALRPAYHGQRNPSDSLREGHDMVFLEGQ